MDKVKNKKIKESKNIKKDEIGNRGFSFVEILAAIVIIGILMSISIVAFSRYKDKAKNNDYEALAKASYNAMEQYVMDHPYEKKANLDTLVDNNLLSNRQDPGSPDNECTGYVEIEGAAGGSGKLDSGKYTVYLCCASYKKKYTYPDGTVENYTGTDRCSAPDVAPTPPPGETSYTITYVLNGGSVSGNPSRYSKSILPITLKNPTKSGYTFDGWTGTGLSGKTKNVVITNGSTGNRTYTANWTKNSETTYTITYVLNGGSVSGNPSKYSASTLPITLKNPTRSGYTFTGWTGTGLSSATKSVTINKNSTGNRTYTANWTKNANQIISCAAGKYLPKNKTSCALCTSGNYCKGGKWYKSNVDQGLTKCPSGYGNSDVGSSKISQCYIKVSAGKHIKTKNSATQTTCGAGTYKVAHTVNYGNTSSCTKCPNGYNNSPAGSTSDTKCYKKVTATFTFNAGTYHNLSTKKYFPTTTESCTLHYKEKGCSVSTPKCKFGSSGNSKSVNLNQLFNCKFDNVTAGKNLLINSTKTYNVSITANSEYVNKSSKLYALAGGNYKYSVIRNDKSSVYKNGVAKSNNYGHINNNHKFIWDGEWLVDNSKDHYIWIHITTEGAEPKCKKPKNESDCSGTTNKKMTGWLFYKMVYYK